MNSKTLMGLFVVLSVAVLVLSGCAVSDYLKGEAGAKESGDNYSLLTEKEELENISGEIGETKEGEIEQITGEVVKEIGEVKEEPETAEVTAKEEASFVIKVKENETVELKPEAVDVDEDVLTYTFSEPLDADGRWQTTFGDAGEYTVTVTASDGITTTSQNVLLVVERVNVPPYIEPMGDIEINEGETLVLEPKVSDLNNDEFTVAISEPVGDSGVWETDYHSAGEYYVTITAEDAESKGVEKIKVIVNKKNMPPTISGVEDITIKEGETVTIEPEIEDLNGDDVKVTISEPVGDDGVWETSYTDHGEYKVRIEADDGKAVATKEITIKVTDVNMPPKIINIINAGKGK